MKKLALVNHYPFDRPKDAKGNLYLELAYIFNKLGMKVELFTLSKRDTISNFSGYVQNEIKLAIPDTDNVLSASRIADFLALELTGFRPSIWRMNKSDKLIDALHRYDPDVIFLTDTMFARSMERYKERYKNKTKIITYSDTLNAREMLDYIDNLATTKAKAYVIKYLKKSLRKRYINYLTELYRRTIDVSDVFVTMTDMHKKMIIKEFPNSKGKVYTILPGFIPDNRAHNNKPRVKIKVLLFIGACSHGPNADAINYILNYLAPKLPDKIFMIVGKGCLKKTVKNVHFIGTTPMAIALNKADVCLSPMTNDNTGVMSKVLAYLAKNKLVIGTASSFIGYKAKSGFNVIIENDLNKYATIIKNLENNPKMMKKIQMNAHTALEGHLEHDLIKAWSLMLKKIK